MAGVARTFCRRSLLKTSRFSLLRYQSQLASAHQEDGGVVYPEIKPRLPPGRWPESWSAKRCWTFYDRGQELLEVPDVRARLEWFAGNEPISLLTPKAFDPQPNTTDFYQHITKTHMVNNSLPELFKKVDVENEFSVLEKIVFDVVQQENNYQYQLRVHSKFPCMEEQSLFYRTHSLLGQILRSITSYSAMTKPHLLRSQLDENVRVESFWKCSGLNNQKNKRIYMYDSFTLQCMEKANYQIRSEYPLPEFVPLDHELCTNSDVPRVNYSPCAVGQKRMRARPVNVSGHWIGDPCEFTTNSINILPEGFPQFGKTFGEHSNVVDQKIATFGLLTAFNSCMAQAYNQGFSYFHELTYPITTQSVVTLDGQWLQFFSYQLNTVQMWNDPKCYPLSNIVWVSEKMPFLEKNTDGEVVGVNTNTCRHLVKCLLAETSDRGINLRPFLRPDQETPRDKRRYINDLGEEPLPNKKIGRWEYPRNAVYY